MILEALAAAIGPGTASDAREGWMSMGGWLWGGQKTSAGTTVSPSSAMKLAVYYACIYAISSDCARLPWLTYRRLGGGAKERAPDHPAYSLLHDAANPEMSAMSFRETSVAHVLGRGNSYAEIQRDGARRPVALWPIHPANVTIRREAGELVYIVRATPTTIVQLSSDDVFHCHNISDDGINGWSVAHVAAESIGAGMATQDYASAFFGNGANPGGVLEYPQTLSPEALQRLRESWAARHQGPDNANKVAILEGGLKFSPISINARDSQFIESRQFQIEEICRWFRMPPHKVQHLLRATFSNIEHQGIEYRNDTIDPWLVRFEQEASRKLMGSSEYFSEHLRDALERADSPTRIAYYTGMLGLGALAPNEVRAMENRNPIEGGDGYYMLMNYGKLGADGVVQTPANPTGNGSTQAPGSDSVPAEEDAAEEATDRDDDTEDTTAAAMAPAILAGCRGPLRMLVERLARKEALSVMKANERGADAAWAGDFYARHSDHIVEDLQPAVLGIARAVGSLAHAGVMCSGIAADHCEAQAAKWGTAEQQDIPAIAERWTDEATDQIIAQIAEAVE